MTQEIKLAFTRFSEGSMSFEQAVSIVIASDRSDTDKLLLIEALLEDQRVVREKSSIFKGRQPDGPHTIL